MIESDLTLAEWLLAGNAALMRQATALKNKRQPRVPGNTQFDETDAHVAGAQAEYAVAKWLNIHWDPAVGISWAGQVVGDVGKLEVRSTAHARGGLLVHPHDFDDRPYLLVRTHRAPTYELHGWLYGREAKQDRFWQPTFKTPCFRVGPEHLRPVEQLLDPVGERAAA